MTDLTDERLLEIAHATGLLAGIRLAAACHPDRVPLEESTAPANAALLRFALYLSCAALLSVILLALIYRTLNT